MKENQKKKPTFKKSFNDPKEFFCPSWGTRTPFASTA